MKRKGIVLIVTFIMLFFIHTSVFADNDISFLDLKSHWSVEYVEQLYNKGIISGYPDGTFKPNNNVTRAEAIKMLIVATGEDVVLNKEGYWAENYIREAISKGYVLEGEFDDYNKIITRGELAKLIVRVLSEEYPSSIIEYSNQIADYTSITESNKDFVLKAFVKGIMTGYPDGTFKPDNNVTRAEASTMLIRFLDPSKRQIPELKKVEVIQGDFFKFENNKLYYIDNNGKTIDTITNSTLMTREEINWYFKTMYDFAENNGLYFTLRFSEDTSNPDFIVAFSKENLEDLNRSAYIAISCANNGNINGMAKIGKNIKITIDSLTSKASHLNRIDVKPYLELSKSIIKKFTGDKYADNLYKEFETMALNKANSDTNSEFYGPIDYVNKKTGKIETSLYSPRGYKVIYDVYIK